MQGKENLRADDWHRVGSATYQPPNNAGDIELQQSQDGNSFKGKWRYGSSGDCVGEWNGTRIR